MSARDNLPRLFVLACFQFSCAEGREGRGLLDKRLYPLLLD